MKKMIIFLSSTILAIGVIMSLLKSANDNGLRAANLHENVLAQLNGSGDDTGGDDTGGDKTGGDKTGGDDTGGSDNPHIMKNGILDKQILTYKVMSDSQGEIHFLGHTIINLQKHTEYTVIIIDYTCRFIADCGNVCDYSMQKTELLNYSKGDEPVTPNP